MAKKRFELTSSKDAEEAALYTSLMLYLIIFVVSSINILKFPDNFDIYAIYDICFVFCFIISLILFYFFYIVFYNVFEVAELEQKEISRKANAKLQLELLNKLEYHSLTQVFVELNTFYSFFKGSLISSINPWDIGFYAKIDRNNDILVFIFINNIKEPIRLRMDFKLFYENFIC